MKNLLFKAAAAMLVLTSCNKSNGDESRYINQENIVGSYKVIAIDIVSNGVAMDGFAVTDACKKDDVYTFKAADEFEYTDAGLTCRTGNSNSKTWGLKADSIFVNGIAGKIVDLTATTMRVCNTNMVMGSTVTTNFVFYRQ